MYMSSHGLRYFLRGLQFAVEGLPDDFGDCGFAVESELLEGLFLFGGYGCSDEV